MLGFDTGYEGREMKVTHHVRILSGGSRHSGVDWGQTVVTFGLASCNMPYVGSAFEDAVTISVNGGPKTCRRGTTSSVGQNIRWLSVNSHA